MRSPLGTDFPEQRLALLRRLYKAGALRGGIYLEESSNAFDEVAQSRHVGGYFYKRARTEGADRRNKKNGAERKKEAAGW